MDGCRTRQDHSSHRVLFYAMAVIAVISSRLFYRVVGTESRGDE